MSRKLLVCFCLVALVASAPMVIGQPEKPADNPPRVGPAETVSLAAPSPTSQAGQRGASFSGPGVNIIYDDGVVTNIPGTSSFCWGNQFNSASGDPVTNFSVTMLSFFLVSGAGTDNVFVSVFGPVNTTAASASVLGSANILTVASNTFNTVSVGPYAGAGSFLAGVWYVAGDTVGLGTGTTNGQGHHGMAINDIVGTGFSTIPGINALVGATSAFIPVELMDFKVTDE